MSDWRERARAIRAAEDEYGVIEVVAAARGEGSEATLPRQAELAKKLIHEILMPVLAEFAGIVTAVPATPVFHQYDQRSLGVTCDLDSVRFAVHVFLLPDASVRIAVFLMPSRAEPLFRDFGLAASGEEVEQWFGASLAKLFEDRVPIHGARSKTADLFAVGAG
jgi:hypothetical protein